MITSPPWQTETAVGHSYEVGDVEFMCEKTTSHREESFSIAVDDTITWIEGKFLLSF